MRVSVRFGSQSGLPAGVNPFFASNSDRQPSGLVMPTSRPSVRPPSGISEVVLGVGRYAPADGDQ